MSYIGEKKIKEATKTDQTTDGGVSLMCVNFKDGSTEYLSSLMYEKVVTDKAIDATTLREKRLYTIIEETLKLLRDWGVKVGELQHFSVLLNQSLNYNTEEATKELWTQYMPRPNSLDDVDLVTIDRVLKSKRKTIDDVIGNQN